MLNRVRDWFAEWTKARGVVEWKRGYDYAAGALLRGADAGDLEAEMDYGRFRSRFDEGMTDAIRDWRNVLMERRA